MNIVFNEISFLPYHDNEYVLKENFLLLMKVFEKAKENYGFTHMLFPINIRDIKVTSNKTFFEWVCGITHQGEKNKILSIVKRPFAEDALADRVGDISRYYYTNTEAGIPDTYCYGLTAAYVMKSLCSSLSLHHFWNETQIEFHKIINDKFETEEVTVNNISEEDHFENQIISRFIENLGEIALEETSLSPEDKPISLREDHGKDKLMAFSKKIRRSKHVLSVINSLPFNPKAINLIKEIYPDGKIELVLYWEDAGYGIVIQTTGRNYRETEAIANILKEEFDK